MAVLEKGSIYRPKQKKGAGLRDFGRGMLNLATSPLSALGVDVYDPTMETKGGQMFEDLGGGIGKLAGNVGIGMATAGITKALGGAKDVASATGGAVDSVIPQSGGNFFGNASIIGEDLSNIAKYGGRLYAMGGDIPTINGGTINGPTVYSRNDPRYKAYQDSLNLYNRFPEPPKEYRIFPNIDHNGKTLRIIGIDKNGSDIVVDEKIIPSENKPIGFTYHNSNKNGMHFNKTTNSYERYYNTQRPIYKKPVAPPQLVNSKPLEHKGFNPSQTTPTLPTRTISQLKKPANITDHNFYFGVPGEEVGYYNTGDNSGRTSITKKELASMIPDDRKGFLDSFGKLYNEQYENSIKKFKLGGELTKYSGNLHEVGGLPISQNDEVEDGETSFTKADGNKYIFSNSINVPYKKHTFATQSKRIESKYNKRLKNSDDAMATTSIKRDLEKLSEFQEVIRESMKTPQQRMMEQMQQQVAMQQRVQPQQFDSGGYLNTMYSNGGRIIHDGVTPGSTSEIQYTPFPTNDMGTFLSTDVYNNLVRNKLGAQAINRSDVRLNQSKPFTPSNGFGSLNTTMGQVNNSNNITPLQSIGYLKQSIPQFNIRGGQSSSAKNAVGMESQIGGDNSYKPGYGLPMTGYAAQALTNLPLLFTKASKVKYDRIKPEEIDLSAQRDELRRNRNLAYATTQRNAGMMDNAGQAGAYASAGLSGINSAYGDQFNKSIMTQNATNVGYRNTAKAQNAEIAMKESEANQMEADAIRSAKMQALSNIGNSFANAGKTFGEMSQQGDYLTAMGIANPDYGLDYNTRGNNFLDFMIGNKPTPYRKKYKCGGKMRRAK